MVDNDDMPQLSGISVEQINLDAKAINNEFDTKALMILPCKNVVLFPGVTVSVGIKRDLSEKTARYAHDNHRPIGVVCQVGDHDEWPSLKDDVTEMGVVADVIKLLELPGGETSALIRGREPFRILGKSRKKPPFEGALMAKVEITEEEMPEMDRKFKLTLTNIKKKLDKIAPTLPGPMGAMMGAMMQDLDAEAAINTLLTNFPFEVEEKAALLQQPNLRERAYGLLRLLNKKEQEMMLTQDIMERVRQDMTDDQRRAFLQKQMDTIHDELYGGEDDADMLQRRADDANMPQAAREVFDRELSKLRRINPQNPDYFVAYTYLDTMLSLPWAKRNEINPDIEAAKEVLDADHSGMEKVKERMLEHIASVIYNPGGKAPILCLVGPPGVGKTSLGRSVATALGLNYQRVSLGGLHDEAEIRGHRRTYIGAMPGRIIDAVKRAGSINPVLVLDEIDKIGADYKGDPSSALLEVLDPEQNCHFHDNYLDVDFDLSNVLFIATANSASTIPAPLLDRMEVISLSGYLPEEKLEIAKAHLMPRIKERMGLDDGDLAVSDEAINSIIDTYTSESGVRQLEKRLSALARKRILAKVAAREFPAEVGPEHLKDLLGLAPFIKEKCEDNSLAGVVTGLAWTEAGGAILLAEASLTEDKGKETVTGNLGDVMKESATIAYQWVKAHASQLGIPTSLFGKYSLHIHFPEGAIPKDGPSAGITIATAIVSAFKQKRVKANMAMTGEITLRGKVLPVGGIKEKMLAAKRAGITHVVLSVQNRKDVEDIDERYTRGLSFHYVDTVLEVMAYAITDEDVANPLAL